jgi:CheY-like chemotaxis protein
VEHTTGARRVLVRVLERRDFRVLEAKDGASGIELFRAHRGDIDVVVLDYTMPGLTGAETFEKLRETDPDVRVVLASGYSEEDASQLFGSGGIRGFVMKPFSPAMHVERLLAAMEPTPRSSS